MGFKKWILEIMVLMLLLTGCGKEEVVYDVENSSENQIVEEEGHSSGIMTGDSLSERLGITTTVWKETIHSDGGEVYVNATIDVPEASNMHTLEVSEHYYTPEEKKELVKYFLGEDDVKVNVDRVETLEWAQKRIEYCDNAINNEYNSREKSFVNMFVNEKEELMLRSNLPLKKDVSEAITDYSENHYICEKDGVEYTLSFDMNEEENRSYWSMVALSEEDFPDKRFYPLYRPDAAENNLCQMTEEEACKKAETICDELGLTNMKAVSVQDLLIHGNVLASDLSEQSRHNGYYIVLARNIDGVSVDYKRYYEKNIYLDTDTIINGYPPEKVVIALNDNGLIEMTYEGCLTVDDMGSSVKLLEFEQIREIFRTELEKLSEESQTWRGLSLEYIRIENASNANQYRYIPIWRLSSDEPYDELGHSPAYYNIFINAMDGSRIYMEEEGGIYYTTVDEYLDYIPEWE